MMLNAIRTNTSTLARSARSRALPLCLALLLSITASLADLPFAYAQGPAKPSVVRGLVILVEFPDVPHQVTREHVALRFKGHLNRYVQEMSGNAVSLDVDVTPGWRVLPKPIGQYRIAPRNLEVDKGRVMGLIEDALDSVGADVDLNRYAFIALMLGAKMQEYGMVGLCGYPGMLGWATQDVFRTRGGRQVRGGVAIFTSQAHLGTLFHDVAHILGGVKDGKRVVPCLYDHDLQARPGPPLEVFSRSIINMGYWDPMSCHFYQRELPPPGVSSWTRLRLGWLDASKVRTVSPGQTAEVLLGPLNDASAQTLAIRIPLSPTSYYLVENRQPLGFDRNLPGSGVLIMLADDTVAECRHGRAPVKLMAADPSAPRLTGAAFDAGTRNIFLDAGNKIKIEILENLSGSFRVRVSPL
jgi:M6 family metalloprotease-like protein